MEHMDITQLILKKKAVSIKISALIIMKKKETDFKEMIELTKEIDLLKKQYRELDGLVHKYEHNKRP